MGDVSKEGRTGERARGRDMVLVPRPAWASITAAPSVAVGEELAVMPLRDGRGTLKVVREEFSKLQNDQKRNFKEGTDLTRFSCMLISAFVELD